MSPVSIRYYNQVSVMLYLAHMYTVFNVH